MKGRNRVVCRRPDGNWVQQRLNADRTSSVHQMRRDAQQKARTQLIRSGGRELITTAEGGEIGRQTPFRLGHDEYPPKG